jgi:hypothetical protein
MATKAKRHTHKYHKVDLPFGKVWACALSDCNHYMPNHLEKLMNGKASICWECEEKLILDAGNMSDNQPICRRCKLGIDDIDELSDAMKKRVGL